MGGAELFPNHAFADRTTLLRIPPQGNAMKLIIEARVEDDNGAGGRVEAVTLGEWIAVGTLVTERPPPGSQRARLTHWALTSGV
jgi:hypothetical protein